MQLPVAESKDSVWSWQLQATVAKKVKAMKSILLYQLLSWNAVFDKRYVRIYTSPPFMIDISIGCC